MILLIGGLGNTFNYLNCLKKTKLNSIIFYEFDAIKNHEEELEKIIIENLNLSTKLKIVAFSISCGIVVKILKKLLENQSLTYSNYSLHLIDPQNIIESIYSPNQSPYKPLKYKGIKNNFGLMMVFSNSIIIKYLWEILKQPIGLYYFKWSYYFHKQTPPEVDHTIIKIGKENVKRIIETYLFNFSPFDLLPGDNNIVHVYTGTKSKYYNHCMLLSEKSCLFKIHKIHDINHHILYHKDCRILDDLID